MQLGIRRVPSSRWPHPPLWSVALVAGWGLLLGASAWLEARTGVEAQTCLFKRVSGHPCPSCGSTRAVMALLRGQWGEAFLWNPLVLVTLMGAAGILAFRLASGSRLVLAWDASGRRLAYVLAGLVILANWVWIWPRS